MIIVDLEKLYEVAKIRPEGYLDDVFSKCKIEGNKLLCGDNDYYALRGKYSPNATPITKVANATKAFGRLVEAKVGGHKVIVSNEEQERRISICKECEFFNGKTCLKCGCVVNWKTKLTTEKCPIGKW